MVSRADVERLRQRAPTPESPILGVYLDVDQARAANRNREFERALATRLKALEQRVTEAARDAFRADAARAQRFVAEYEPRATTLVVFADDSADLFWSGGLRVALPTDARWQPTPYVRPLAEAVDGHRAYGVALVDKARARVFRVFLGEIAEERETIATAEVRHKNASGTDHLRSQMNFQRQDDMHVRAHLRRAAELLEEMARVHGFERLVLAGPVEATSALARLLPHPLDGRVVGTVRVPIDALAATVLEQTLPVAERAEREAEKTRVQQVLDRGAVGLDAVLDALQAGRLMALVYGDGFAARGRECPRCHALFAARPEPACGYCGAGLDEVDDLVERALQRALESGASTDKVHGEAAARLRDAGGIGAVLRF